MQISRNLVGNVAEGVAEVGKHLPKSSSLLRLLLHTEKRGTSITIHRSFWCLVFSLSLFGAGVPAAH